MAKAKKDFKGDNPALAFITIPEEAPTAPAPTETTPELPAAEQAGKPPKGYKVNPLYVETKSRRVQLLMQPSIADAAKDYAAAQGLSMNELVALALKEYLEKHSK